MDEDEEMFCFRCGETQCDCGKPDYDDGSDELELGDEGA